MRIIFVCQGNIIRSPLAENMFRHLAQERGLSDKYEVDSAGTSAYHIGEPPDHRMRKVAEQKGFVYTGRAKQFWAADFDQFDLVIAMDKANQRYLETKASQRDQIAKIHLMREYDPEGKPDSDVPDPYYGGLDGFEVTFEIVKRSCQGLLEALEK